MEIPFVDLKAQYRQIQDEVDPAVLAVMQRGDFVLGGAVTEFERAFADYCGVKYCVGVDSGYSALEMIVRAYDIGPGDEVILPTPWYFNHKMWLDMASVTTVPLDTGASLIPDAAACAALITSRTRAIVLVSPNNPGGVEYPAEILSAFRDIARTHGLALIVDETYRDFDSRHSIEMGGRPHDLFADPAWGDTLIQLYSFSKAYRLTGHRVGAIVADGNRLAEVEKFLDTVAICPSQLGQIGAGAGEDFNARFLDEGFDEDLVNDVLCRAAVADIDQLRGCARLRGDHVGCRQSETGNSGICDKLPACKCR